MVRRTARRKPPKTQTRRSSQPGEPLPSSYWDVTHRPLQCLVFLLPLVIVYEVGMALLHHRASFSDQPTDLAAQQLLYWFFSLFGATGYFLPGLALIAVLLAWHIACRHPWRVAWNSMPAMAAESLLLAVPVVLMNHWIPAHSPPEHQGLSALLQNDPPLLRSLLLSVGAGIYEELVFRLIIISLLSLLLIDIARMRQVPGVALAVILSSLMFAAHHHPPIGADPWSTSEFAFRASAGAYLAAVYVLRGFGLAVGCHVMYDVLAVLLSR